MKVTILLLLILYMAEQPPSHVYFIYKDFDILHNDYVHVSLSWRPSRGILASNAPNGLHLSNTSPTFYLLIYMAQLSVVSTEFR